MITAEQKEFILNNYKFKTNLWLEEQTGLNRYQIKNFKHKNHLDSGLTGWFEKGSASYNKGLKWEDFMSKEAQERCRKGQFKKGNVPPNHRPVGTETIRSDGYIWVKVAEPNKCREKHRLVWEQHYCKLPRYQKITFLDGNRSNCNINNLILLSNRESQLINLKYKWSNDAEINKSILASVRLELKLKDIDRKEKNV